jgi:hypothetical protein
MVERSGQDIHLLSQDASEHPPIVDINHQNLQTAVREKLVEELLSGAVAYASLFLGEKELEVVGSEMACASDQLLKLGLLVDDGDELGNRPTPLGSDGIESGIQSRRPIDPNPPWAQTSHHPHRPCMSEPPFAQTMPATPLISP